MAAQHPRRWRSGRVLGAAMALTVAGGLTLSGCQQAKQTMDDAATGVGDAAQDAATATGQAALTAAVNPVLDQLKKAQAQVEDGNLETAAVTMDGFKSLWERSAPVIRPMAGDKWPGIESAANNVVRTFDGGTPARGAASSAISGLIGPLNGLIGQ
jgi:hypothetical protein